MTSLLRQRDHPPADPRDPPGAAEARDDARALMALAAQSAASRIGRNALILRLSLLPELLTRPHHRRLAQEALLPLLGADRAVLFRLPNADLAVVWRQASEAVIETCLAGLRHLFADAAEAGEMLITLTLPVDALRLHELAEASLSLPPAPAAEAAESHPPLDAPLLTALEGALAQAGMARFMRRMAVCMAGEGGLVRQWEHRHLSIGELAETMVPGRDLQGDPWLFRHLCGVIDRRVLALLAAPGELSGAGPFSLALNVASLLSPEFLRFDAAVPAQLRGRLVIALRAVDTLADPAASLFARDFLRSRGYLVALGGLGVAQMPIFAPRIPPFDLAFMRFSGPGEADLPRDQSPDRIVLFGCDEPEALAWGKTQGISRFAGRMIRPR